MAGVKPPLHLRVPGSGPVHPLEIATNRILSRVPQQNVRRTAAQTSVKATTSPGAGGGGGSINASSPAAGVTISTTSPVAETAGAAGASGTTGLAADAGHVHPMPAIFPVDIQVGGVDVAARSIINFVSGASAVDNVGATRVDVTVSGAGGAVLQPRGGVPLLGAMTWLNQGSATATQNADGSLTLRNTGAVNALSILYVAAPATPYTWTIGYLPRLYLTGSPTMGMVLVDSASGLCYPWNLLGNVSAFLAAQEWTNATTFSATDATSPALLAPTPIYQRVSDNGATRRYWWSADGVNFEETYNNTSAHWLTPNKIGIDVNTGASASRAEMTLVYWNVV